MRNNDIIQSIRYMLDIDDVKIAHILKLRNYKPRREEVSAIFEDSDEPGEQKQQDSSDELMAHFLDGLIYYLRGKSDKHPPRPIKTPVTNNMVLKKLRVAFKLQEDDMHDIMEAAGFPLSKPEMSALFRSEGSKNYRECGDQILRYFLKGLTMRVREEA